MCLFRILVQSGKPSVALPWEYLFLLWHWRASLKSIGYGKTLEPREHKKNTIVGGKRYCKRKKILCIVVYTRNKQKRVKNARHAQEKEYMEQLRGVGVSVGEYIGQGMGDTEIEEADKEAGQEDNQQADKEVEQVDEQVELEQVESEANNSQNLVPNSSLLLFFFDCEATGLSIYNDNITELAAKVITTQSTVTQPTFSSLVHTSRHIPKKGINVLIYYG